MTTSATASATPLLLDLDNMREAMNEAFVPAFKDRHRFQVHVGGAGSGKSESAAFKWLVRLMTEDGHRLLVLRKVAKTLRTSVFLLFRDIIGRFGWTPWFQINKSDFTITFLPNGNQIFCCGLDDPEKLKSITSITGEWLEEATEFSEDDFNQVNLRLRGHTPYYKQIILSFNPISIHHWIKRRFFDTDQYGKTFILRTTHHDNRFLDQDYHDEIEALKFQNPSLYQVYGEGLWGKIEGLVYPDVTILLAEDWPEQVDEVIYGLDFGFNNPSALIEVCLEDIDRQRMRGNVYLKERIFERELTTPELSEAMERLQISKQAPIYADNSEPDRIKGLRKAGWNIWPCKKGGGPTHSSVRDGIDMCQSLTLFSSADSVNLNAEFSSYAWDKRSDGEKRDMPVKRFDHGMDAMRYALYTHLKKPGMASFTRSQLGT